MALHLSGDLPASNDYFDHLDTGRFTLLASGPLTTAVDLRPGDFIVTRGHGILFEKWNSNHTTFSILSFGGGLDGLSPPLESSGHTFSGDLDGHPASGYSAFRYNNVLEDLSINKLGGLLGDFDGDGKPDVAALTLLNRDTVAIGQNTSTQGYPSKQADVNVSSGWATVNNMMVTDFDGDGKADIVGRNGDHLLMWRSTSSAGTFSFAPYVDLGTGSSTVSRFLDPADYNGDGKPDIAAFSADLNTLYISRNTSTPGHPSKAGGVLISSGWASVDSMTAVDFDGDGKADILGRIGDHLYIWRSTSTGSTFSFASALDLGPGSSTVSRFLQPVDYDGDGKPDVAAFSADRSTLYISRNTSTPGNPSKAGGVLVSSGWATVDNFTVADFDGDGKADLLGRNGDTLLTWRSTSTASAFSFAPYTVLDSAAQIWYRGYLSSMPA
jgi:hypothetical protein